MGKRILVAVVCIPLIFVVFFCLPPHLPAHHDLPALHDRAA